MQTPPSPRDPSDLHKHEKTEEKRSGLGRRTRWQEGRSGGARAGVVVEGGGIRRQKNRKQMQVFTRGV